MNFAAHLNAIMTPLSFETGQRLAHKLTARRPAEILGLPKISDLDPLKAVVLEHQHGMYRVFHVAGGGLILSHECKVEAIRRAEQQGLQFGVL